MNRKQTITIAFIMAGVVAVPFTINHLLQPAPRQEPLIATASHTVTRGGICSMDSDCGFGLACQSAVCQEDPGQHVPNG